MRAQLDIERRIETRRKKRERESVQLDSREEHRDCEREVKGERERKECVRGPPRRDAKEAKRRRGRERREETVHGDGQRARGDP